MSASAAVRPEAEGKARVGAEVTMKHLIKTALALVLAATAAGPAAAAAPGTMLVGGRSGGGLVAATGQLLRPAGQTIELPGSRPVDAALSRDGKTLFVKDNRGLLLIDTASWSLRQQISFPEGGGSMHGIAVTAGGSRVFATTAQNQLWEGLIGPDGKLSWGRKIVIPGPNGKTGDPAALWGIALSADEKTAYVCLSRNNALAVVDLQEGKLLRQIPVGVAPYGVAVSPDGREAYVSNWGGRRPKKGERTGKSAGTDTLVDERGVAKSGTVSVVGLVIQREITQVPVGLHPAGMALSPDGRRLYVANANSDTVSILDIRSRKVVETVLVRPDASLPFGSAPNAVALSPDGKTLYAANGGNNAIAAVSLGAAKDGGSVVKGFIPTAWYPGAVVTDGQNLYVANVKGFGARSGGADAAKRDIMQHLGAISKAPVPDAAALTAHTARVRADARVPQALVSLEKARAGKKPVPVPARAGEPSVFEHVVYIVKENKTYDQVFGDLPRGNNDPSLCIFGREASPNHHVLAEQFVILDNYYCNGVLSADGHSWVTEANVTDHLEKSFGGFTRSYSFGDDALTYSSSGLIWDNVLAHGLSFRNYGEFDTAEPVPASSWKSIYDDYINKTGKISFSQNMPSENLRRYSCREYPGWNMNIPDVLRADVFLKELKAMNATGAFPNFVVIYLPDDHTSGGMPGSPTPRAQVADNDLALGRVIEGISKSRFWPKTCIFVIEDDPQSGFDHVDGHRSLCLVASPYTKRGALVSQFYNQTSVIHTMERILGIPPMNQMDAMSPLMTDCFTDKPDFRPYTCLANRIPLDEMPKAASNFYRKKDYIASGGRLNPFRVPDRIDDDEMNRAIWHSVKGEDAPYPAEFAGAHGRGLAELRLALAPEAEDDD